ncbi:MAG: (Fe-S)-binding protein [Bacteroidales bacterium]|jgi:L-lactate dehydrogenase complex protein LldE|nr:(Fe-S)-binding protein [Bacteroidales bacterium]
MDKFFFIIFVQINSMNVEVFISCCVNQFSPQTGDNLISLLRKLGNKVENDVFSHCCGRFLYENGSFKESKLLSQKLIDAFKANNYIVGCSASCIGYIKNDMEKQFIHSPNYASYKRVSEKVVDITEFLVDIAQIYDVGAYFPHKVSILYNCKALNEYNIVEETKVLLQNVKGLEIVSKNINNFCCGYGGMFSLKNDAISEAMAKKKIEQIMDEGAEYVVSSDLSCLLHLKSYIDKNKINLKTIHIIDLLTQQQ